MEELVNKKEVLGMLQSLMMDAYEDDKTLLQDIYQIIKDMQCIEYNQKKVQYVCRLNELSTVVGVLANVGYNVQVNYEPGEDIYVIEWWYA